MKVQTHLFAAAIIGGTCLQTALYAAPTGAIKPSFLEYRLTPPALTLTNGRDVRKVVVSGRTADGFWMDVTPSAKFEINPIITRDAEGFVHPVKPGSCKLQVAVGGKSVSLPVNVKSIAQPPISFVRDVMPILSRTACSAGTCHGSAKGKNGFKLSLRGYDPDYDYHALIEDIAGRRFNRAKPEYSLMLQKPTQAVPHQGGLVFEENSRFYPTIYRWIAEGVKYDGDKVKRASRIEVLPAQPKMSLPGEKQQLIVLAHFADGSTRDVTADAVFTSTMPETCTVTPEGTVSAVRRGEASVLVRYEGNYAANGITVIGDRTGFRYAGQPEYNYIDKLIDAKLARIKTMPSAICTDAEFIRRSYIDITGVPPTPDDVRGFMADKTDSREKRTKLVDNLIDSPDYADNWANKWSDLLSVNRKFLGERGAWKFKNWIHDQVASNRPYNEFVREIISAQGSTYEHPAASYYRVAREPNQAAENITQLFLGIRFSCNKCHDHPFERWTQTQYYQFAANFGRVGYKGAQAEGDETIVEKPTGEVIHPKLNTAVAASYPYPITAKLDTGNRREILASWLTSSTNPLFAKSWVNRIWSYFLGKGIIDPVDDIRSSNPAINPELLDTLTADFIKNGFDTKRLIRTICASRTYQASIKTNIWNRDDNSNFSHALPRRLTAEQLVDALSRATGSLQRYPGAPAGFRAVQLLDPSVAGGGFLDLFGRPVRESPCECERSSTVSLGQTLNLVNGSTINDAVSDPNGRLAAFLKSSPTDKQVLDEVFLSALCRLPSESEVKRAAPSLQITPKMVKEMQEAAKMTKSTTDEATIRTTLRTHVAQDILWALINSPAFLFNR